METKFFQFEVKELGKVGEFEGYGSVFSTVDQGGDIVMPGAFDKALAKFTAGKSRPKMLWQHDPGEPIGIWDSMSVDARGLRVKGRLLTEIPRANTVNALLKAGALDGLSIGYRVVEHEYEETERGTLRKLTDLELWEVSVVTFPMNTDATVTDVKRLDSVRDAEQVLRAGGVPAAFAKLVALYGYAEAILRLKSKSRDATDDATAQAHARLSETMSNMRKALKNG